MDWDAMYRKAVSGAIKVQRDNIIAQTLKEDHDFIMYMLDKKFAKFIEELSSDLKQKRVKQNVREEIYIKINELYDIIKVVVAGDDKEIKKPKKKKND